MESDRLEMLGLPLHSRRSKLPAIHRRLRPLVARDSGREKRRIWVPQIRVFPLRTNEAALSSWLLDLAMLQRIGLGNTYRNGSIGQESKHPQIPPSNARCFVDESRPAPCP